MSARFGSATPSSASASSTTDVLLARRRFLRRCPGTRRNTPGRSGDERGAGAADNDPECNGRYRQYLEGVQGPEFEGGLARAISNHEAAGLHVRLARAHMPDCQDPPGRLPYRPRRPRVRI